MNEEGGSDVVMAFPTSAGQWTFLTNYAHVLIVIADQPELRLREIADSVGITERATQRIVRELVREGYLSRERVGRRNAYTVHRDAPLRHPLQDGLTVGHLIDALQPVQRGSFQRPNGASPADYAPRASR